MNQGHWFQSLLTLTAPAFATPTPPLHCHHHLPFMQSLSVASCPSTITEIHNLTLVLTTPIEVATIHHHNQHTHTIYRNQTAPLSTHTALNTPMKRVTGT